MGTNYFLHRNKCDKCGRYDEVHIGKSSGGWRFVFHYIPNAFEKVTDWMQAMADGQIFDEYGRLVSFNEFWTTVDIKQKELRQCGLQGFRDIDNYDFLEGDFS